MLRRKTARVGALMLVLVLALLAISGCSSSDDDKVIELGYVQWACANANSHLVKVILEEEYDVEVNLRSMDAGVLWQSVATGDIDFMVTAWLPTTHESYYSQLKDDVVDLGPLYEGAAIGLVVPQYVDIDSIEELNDNAEKFNNRIIGIDPAAGIMSATNSAIDEYGLELELITSSDSAMTAELKAAYDDEEWVVVTGWAPHWKFGSFDLKFLEDPNNIYGGSETINPITRLDFADDHPEINDFLDNYFLTGDQFGSLIATLEDYEDDTEGAKAWIEENRELVDSWLE